MGRRRSNSRQQQSGVAEDIATLIIATSRRWAPAGFVFCIAFIVWGVYLLNHQAKWFGFARYIGPIAILAGLGCAGLAGYGILQRRRQPEPASHPGVWTIDAVHALSWQQFERLIADLFRRQGYAVRETGRDAQRTGTGDGGVDLILTDPKSPGAEFLVQCKQYKVWSVGEPKAREFYGAMAAWKTRCEGILITCGRFTQPAEAFAAGKPLRLIDGNGLIRLLNAHNAIAPAVTTAAPPAVMAASRPASPAVATTAPPPARSTPPPSPAASPLGVPTCPNCKVAMVQRVATKGQRKGQPFWGCVNYPACRATIGIAR